MASHYLQSFSQARQLSVPDADGQSKAEGSPAGPATHLDICHDTLCESAFFQVRAEASKACLALLQEGFSVGLFGL